jgi:putative tricarboxylic transport membrane protein
LRLGNQIIAILFILLGLFFLTQSPQYQLFTLDAGAGPGLLPMLTGGAIVLAAIGLLVVSQSTEPVALEPDLVPHGWGLVRLLGIIAALAMVVVLMSDLGYRITMFLFLVATIRLLGRFNPLLILAVALAGSFGLYWVFNDKLLVILPVGPFGI